MSENISAPKKRRWYHNLRDAYTITARTYPWIGWLMGGSAVVLIALGIALGAITSAWFMWVFLGISTAALVAMALLAWLVRKAMYAQVEGTVGAVYAVLSQIKRGWIVPEQPLTANREQDIIWRIIGRQGVVLISEGPSSRVAPMLEAERKKVVRVARNVPVHIIQVGRDEGQVPLGKLEGELSKLKKELTKEEVPAISQRLTALSRTQAPIPKGIDPTKVRANRRALRGR